MTFFSDMRKEGSFQHADVRSHDIADPLQGPCLPLQFGQTISSYGTKVSQLSAGSLLLTGSLLCNITSGSITTAVMPF